MTSLILFLTGTVFGAAALFVLWPVYCCMTRKPVLGHCKTIINSDPKFGSARVYNRVPVVFGGERNYLLLTNGEMANALGRTASNPEDCPEPNESPLTWPVLRVDA
ncbi:MAG TPA: hypothetical protein VEH04_16910 [Verrucomicrobiae bacterium]|nr:hypothetical protein [Verrucomicrobiae bacterium]